MKSSIRLLLFGIIICAFLLIFSFYAVGNIPGVRARLYALGINTLKHSEESVPLEFHGNIHLFVLMGQSNMSGRAPLLEDPTPSKAFLFGNDYQWKQGYEPIDDPTNQVDLISLDDNAAFGPGIAFGKAYREDGRLIIVGLIPCAKGGSTILEWQKDYMRDSLYGSCLYRVRQAERIGLLKGILVFQGEQDALDPARFKNGLYPSVQNYAVMFEQFLNDFRGDVGYPNLPTVFAQLGTHSLGEERFPNWGVIKEQQESIQLPCTAMIRTQDLPVGDGLHFTLDGYRAIGIRFSDAIKKLMSIASCQSA